MGKKPSFFNQAYEERRRRKDEEREAQQLAEEQEAARKEAERLARENAEAEQWLGQISTEKEGTSATAAAEEKASLLARGHPVSALAVLKG